MLLDGLRIGSYHESLSCGLLSRHIGFLPMSRVPLIALIFLFSPGLLLAQKTWTQTVERQPVVERGQDIAEPADKDIADIPDSAFSGGTVPKWIWGPDNNSNYVLRTTVELQDIKAARLRASCDNVGTVFINGKRVGGSSEWQEPVDADVASALVKGTNVIEAEVENQGAVAAFVLKLIVQPSTGDAIEIVTSETWTYSTKRDTDSKDTVQLRGEYGGGPWGLVFNNAAMPGRVPAGVFEVLPGFQVDKLYTVPKDELGSWVCITFDNKGRLLASDQGDKGLFRITLPPVNGEGGVSVEQLDFSKCEVKPSGAQGMLWAFDSLYICCNGGPGSGLYRARDKDGDDQFDECVKLKDLRGGGEHGPHALRLSPDGKRIFLIAGNHTRPPFDEGEELKNPNYTSRVPTNWAEDHLLPRMWDANGHAVGILAPGGWIASTDPDGKTWDIWSMGYRNPYDMAFNADGELFAYDADMEWDVGMPWYRPTRVVHATSGSEFGWRSGSGKWPNHYLDSLPPMVNIGPGCPVGVEFGYNLRFPAKYQKALFICDWTFGTMYAIHTQPNMSSYTATKEEFLSRTPLPLTDVVAGPDGAMYFTVGGRGTQSELFRVTYAGKESTEPAVIRDSSQAGARSRRKVLEAAHAGIGPNGKQSPMDAETFMKNLQSDVRTNDRFLKTASRNAFYHSALYDIVMKTEVLKQADFTMGEPDDKLGVVIALAKTPFKSADPADTEVAEMKSDLQRVCLNTLRSMSWSSISREQHLGYLRALSLVFLRLGAPDDAVRQEFVGRIDDAFPSGDDELDRELCQMLVYLNSPTVIAKTVKLLEAPSKPTVTDDMKDLLARNRGYGGAIAESVAKAPDQQQTWYAFCLRNAKDGWKMDERKIYFAWFERAHQWAGGASYHGFLRNIERECFENASEKERLLIEASGARKPYTLPEIPKPAGPGKDWTLEEVRGLAKDGLKGRDFDNGQKMFAATRCVICHRFGGDGGATGPDLTQLAGRFNLNDLTEAIMVPSKVISDQYKGTTVVTTSGKSYSGRIVGENDELIRVLTSPEDPTKISEISKSEIEELQPSPVSIMPMDLLKPLNQDEVLDLLAYLLSRGDKGNAMFRK
jgi:putative heme-binding domain-containing protein